MTYIVFDLEWNATFKKRQLPEIVEIGAAKVRVMEGVPTMMETFHCYVRPVFRNGLTKKTRRMTGITEEDIEQALPFPQALQTFLDWIGPEEYFLCTWGDTDRSVLVENCMHHGIPLRWLRNYNDVQAAMMQTKNIPRGNQVGLAKALELMEIPFEGRHHRSVDDAVNTAQIFLKVFSQTEWKRNLCIPREFLHKNIQERRAWSLIERGAHVYLVAQGHKQSVLFAQFDHETSQGWIAERHALFAPERRMRFQELSVWAQAVREQFGLSYAGLLRRASLPS